MGKVIHAEARFRLRTGPDDAVRAEPEPWQSYTEALAEWERDIKASVKKPVTFDELV